MEARGLIASFGVVGTALLIGGSVLAFALVAIGIACAVEVHKNKHRR